MLDKLHIYLAVFAAAIMTITGLLTDMSLPEAVIRLIYVIIIFYILGLIIRAFLKKRVFTDETEPPQGQDGNNTDNSEANEDNNKD